LTVECFEQSTDGCGALRVVKYQVAVVSGVVLDELNSGIQAESFPVVGPVSYDGFGYDQEGVLGLSCTDVIDGLHNVVCDRRIVDRAELVEKEQRERAVPDQVIGEAAGDGSFRRRGGPAGSC
jgi:hypothetical protein